MRGGIALGKVNRGFRYFFVEPSAIDPQPDPPACFLNRKHVAELAEMAQTPGNSDENNEDDVDQQELEDDVAEPKSWPVHKPRRVLRTVLSSMESSDEFGPQMAKEAKRRRFDDAPRKAFVCDGLACNWTIHAKDFSSYVPVLDFVHAVSHLFSAAVACFGKTDEAWAAYIGWMRQVWLGKIDAVKSTR